MADPVASSAGASWIAVCQKWVATRPEIDAVTGLVSTDERWSGPSLADQAALEWGLRLAERCGGRVAVVTVGVEAAEAMLRDALAVGATRVFRVPISEHEQPSSLAVARAMADVLRPLEPAMVLCGDWSLDRGSASVPPFLAAELGLGQVCGLVGLDVSDPVGLTEAGRDPAGFTGNRRLDGGRREQFAIDGPTVLSVEGAAAALRRAPLGRVLAARSAPVELVQPAAPLEPSPEPIRSGVFRPRARLLDGPDPALPPLARIERLTGALLDRTPPQTLVLEPEAAADRILEQLEAWGYRPVAPPRSTERSPADHTVDVDA